MTDSPSGANAIIPAPGPALPPGTPTWVKVFGVIAIVVVVVVLIMLIGGGGLGGEHGPGRHTP